MVCVEKACLHWDITVCTVATQPGLCLPRPLLSVLSLFPQMGSRVLAGVRRCAVWWLDELYYQKAMAQGAEGLPLL